MRVRKPGRTSVAHFEHLYRQAPDPWNFESSEYELFRYQTLLSALGKPNYRSALEAGCSIGVFTTMLAPRCNKLFGFDFSASAVESARHRCQALPQVTLEVADLTTFQPADEFELIVFSEVGYYFELPALNAVAQRMVDWLAVAGELVAGHWLGHSDDHVLHGDAVHDMLIQALPLRSTYSARFDAFRVDAWKR